MYYKEKQREYLRRRHEEALPAYHALMSCYPFTLEDLPGEEWKDIEGYNGDYQVSTFGRVKSFKQGKTMIRKPQLRRGYLGVNLFIDGKMKEIGVHVLVAQAFIPNPEQKPEVNHIVGCKFNCHVSNLEWATSSENKRHAVKTGLMKTGEDHHGAKVKNTDAVYIRDNPDNLSPKELAEKFALTSVEINNIQRGDSYPNAGGIIRKARKRAPNVTDEIRAAILADWATGNFTPQQLATKYDYCTRTISIIISAA